MRTRNSPERAKMEMPELWIDEVRAELRAVTDHLVVSGGAGVSASLPHLERAVAVFSSQIDTMGRSAASSSISALREELALANRLYDNAYALQAGWQGGPNPWDPEVKPVLYGRPGEAIQEPRPSAATWEG